jgi:hypothetical protein
VTWTFHTISRGLVGLDLGWVYLGRVGLVYATGGSL